MKPTQELYDTLHQAFEHFNAALFENKLPDVIFVVQRSGGGVMGHFSHKRWVNSEAVQVDEISINPTYIAQSQLIEVMQTLVHEQVHQFQEHFGRPSRQCYHNKEWARMMIKVGLMPSTTGAPGGAITGQFMDDYVIAGGPFHRAYHKLIEERKFKLRWVDRRAVSRLHAPMVVAPSEILAMAAPGSKEIKQYYADTIDLDIGSLPSAAAMADFDSLPAMADCLPEMFYLEQAAKRKTRYRYMCPGCGTKVYGKWELDIQCNDCDMSFEFADVYD